MESGTGEWVHLPEDEGCCSGLLHAFMPPAVRDEVLASAQKIELHSVLNAFQSSAAYGVHVCETFRDPRRFSMDDYWEDVQCEAVSLEELHKLIGGSQQPQGLTNEARARLHQFSRLLERLSRRIDRVVLS
jgi:hypothetical protein